MTAADQARAEALAKGNAETARVTQEAAQQKAQSLEAGQRATGIQTSHGFDAAGNRLNDQGQIVQFAGQQAKESYLAERGYGNTGKVINPDLATKADFSNLAGYSTVTNIGPRHTEVDIHEGLGIGNELSGSASTVSTKSSSGVDSLFSGDEKTARANQLIEQQNINAKVDNALTRLSNKDIREKNLQNEKDLLSFIHKGQNQDATFSFFVGDKKVSEASGSKTFYTFLKTRAKYGDNVSIQETFPSKEKALTESVQKNTDFFQNLPSRYWKSAGKSGFISQNNVDKINTIIDLNVKKENREELSNLQGFTSDYIGTKYQNNPITGKTPYKQEYHVDATTGKLVDINPDNGAVSFMRMPGSGGKIYNQILTDIGQKPTTGKISSSNIPSTSFVDVAQFLPIGGSILSEGSILGVRGGIALAKIIRSKVAPTWEERIASSFKQGKKISSEQTPQPPKYPNGVNPFNRPLAPEKFIQPKGDPMENYLTALTATKGVRKFPTVAATNPTREKIPQDVFVYDTASHRGQISTARVSETPYFQPQSKQFENVQTERQQQNQNIQNSLITPISSSKVSNITVSLDVNAKPNANVTRLLAKVGDKTIQSDVERRRLQLGEFSISPLTSITNPNAAISPKSA